MSSLELACRDARAAGGRYVRTARGDLAIDDWWRAARRLRYRCRWEFVAAPRCERPVLGWLVLRGMAGPEARRGDRLEITRSPRPPRRNPLRAQAAAAATAQQRSRDALLPPE